MVKYEPLDKLHRFRMRDRLVMLCSESLCYRSRVRSLIEPVAVIEADGEGLDRLPHHLGHKRDDRARVYAAAQECAERDVRNQAAADGVDQQAPGFLRSL